MTKEYYIDIFRTGKKHFWSRIRSSNRKILWVSEVITSKQNVLNPVRKLVAYLGKKKCEVVYHDELKNKSEVL